MYGGTLARSSFVCGALSLTFFFGTVVPRPMLTISQYRYCIHTGTRICWVPSIVLGPSIGLLHRAL